MCLKIKLFNISDTWMDVVYSEKMVYMLYEQRKSQEMLLEHLQNAAIWHLFSKNGKCLFMTK